MSEQTPTNIANADFTFKDKNGNTGSNKGLSANDGIKLNNMVKLMNLILNTPNSTDYINTLRNGRLPTEIVISTTPLSDANLHLADGALLSGSGSYAKFVDEIIAKYTANPNASCWTTEANWQSSVSTYGECGKYVIDITNNTVRLPKLKSFIQATTTASELGSLVEAGAPNINGVIPIESYSTNTATGAFRVQINSLDLNHTFCTEGAGTSPSHYLTDLDASRLSSVYGNSTTIQPQAIKYYFYIVVGTVSKTDIQIDIDNVMTDLALKADTDLSNTSPSATFKNSSIEWDRPDYLSGVAITLTLNTDVSYTVPENGFIAYTLSATGSDYPTYLKVNGTSVIYMLSFSTYGAPQATSAMILVKKGDIVTIRAGGENAGYISDGRNNATFFPCLGV